MKKEDKILLEKAKEEQARKHQLKFIEDCKKYEKEINNLNSIEELEFILKEWIYKYKNIMEKSTTIDMYMWGKQPDYVEERINQIIILIKKLKETK